MDCDSGQTESPEPSSPAAAPKQYLFLVTHCSAAWSPWLLKCLQSALFYTAASSVSSCIIVGSITGNTNTLAGNVPPKADLGDLSGLVGSALFQSFSVSVL